MRFVLSALGSAGDVHPFIAIGVALAARGHDVSLLAPPPFEARIVQAGLAFAPFGTAAEFDAVLADRALWDPVRGARIIVDQLLARLPEAYATTDALARDRDTIVVGSTLSWGMRLVQETRRLRGATIHLSPTCIASATAPPIVPGLGDLSWIPPAILGPLQRAGERLVVDRVIAPRLDPLRARLGLPPVRHVVTRWMHAPDLVIGAWPAWFAPRQRDWPAQARTSAFPLFAEKDAALPPDVAAFVGAGPAPIGVTPGSAMAHGERFFARALAACAASGRRALVVTPYRSQLPDALPPTVKVVDYVPFGPLLPTLAALVHHGGIGTSAQALAAGIPQVVVPFAHDQFDNAARLRRLGVATTLSLSDDDATWARAVGDRLDDAAVARSVADLARRMADDGPAAPSIATMLEDLGERRSSAA